MSIPDVGQALTASPDAGDGSSGTFSGGQVYFPGGISMVSGNGVPGNFINGTGVPVTGDLYFRLDGGVGSTIYRCTAGGNPATWSAIL